MARLLWKWANASESHFGGDKTHSVDRYLFSISWIFCLIRPSNFFIPLSSQLPEIILTSESVCRRSIYGRNASSSSRRVVYVSFEFWSAHVVKSASAREVKAWPDDKVGKRPGEKLYNVLRNPATVFSDVGANQPILLVTNPDIFYYATFFAYNRLDRVNIASGFYTKFATVGMNTVTVCEFYGQLNRLLISHWNLLVVRLLSRSS